MSVPPVVGRMHEVLAGVLNEPETKAKIEEQGADVVVVLDRYGDLRDDRAGVDAGVDEVNVVVVATETFSRRNQNASVA